MDGCELSDWLSGGKYGGKSGGKSGGKRWLETSVMMSQDKDKRNKNLKLTQERIAWFINTNGGELNVSSTYKDYPNEYD